MFLNRCTLIGSILRLGEPTWETVAGRMLLDLALYVEHKQGNHTEVLRITVQTWHHLATIVHKHYRVGDFAYVEGRLSQTDKTIQRLPLPGTNPAVVCVASHMQLVSLNVKLRREDDSFVLVPRSEYDRFQLLAQTQIQQDQIAYQQAIPRKEHLNRSLRRKREAPPPPA